jgi:hypothetical protein
MADLIELPEPISREDELLHNIADGVPDIDDLIPQSREEVYLKYIALNGGVSGNAHQKIGAWEPTLVNYTDEAHQEVVVDPTYSVVYSNAYYLKMGKLVCINFRIKVEIDDIGTGFACVAGLPFKPDADMLGQAFCIGENSAVTESSEVVYDGVVGQLYPDIYLETYNERHMPAISLRSDNGIMATTFKVGTNWISYSGCYICDDPYVPPQETLVTIEHGGTSGKTSDEARENLDIYSKEEINGLNENNVVFNNSNNIELREKTKILGKNETGTEYEILGLNEYEIDEETYDQVEVGGESVHLNLNTNDDPTYEERVTVDAPSGKKIIAYMADILPYTTENDHFYVSKTGSDTAGDGTFDNPYLTITHALSTVPKIVNHSVTIDILEGSYSESIYILGFCGTGSLSVSGRTNVILGGTVSIMSNTLKAINLNGIKSMSTSGNSLSNNTGIVTVSNCEFGDQLYSSYGLVFLNTVTVTSDSECVVAASAGARVIIKDLTVTPSSYAVKVNLGAQIILQNDITSTSGAVSYYKATGGSIIYPNGTFTA